MHLQGGGPAQGAGDVAAAAEVGTHRLLFIRVAFALPLTNS